MVESVETSCARWEVIVILQFYLFPFVFLSLPNGRRVDMTEITVKRQQVWKQESLGHFLEKVGVQACSYATFFWKGGVSITKIGVQGPVVQS